MRLNLTLVLLLLLFQLTNAQHIHDLIITSQYFHFPVAETEELSIFNLTIGGNIFRNFELKLSDKTDFWVYLGISEYKGEKLTLGIIAYRTSISLCWQGSLYSCITNDTGEAKRRLAFEFNLEFKNVS